MIAQHSSHYLQLAGRNSPGFVTRATLAARSATIVIAVPGSSFELAVDIAATAEAVVIDKVAIATGGAGLAQNVRVVLLIEQPLSLACLGL